MRQLIKSNPALRRLYYRFKSARAAGQSDESQIIAALTRDLVAPRTFVEFGFHPAEFNCAQLARDPAWRGLLIDGNAQQVADAKALFPDRIQVVEAFLTRENLDFIKSAFAGIGVLSIDVDGNDYWFLKDLIDTRPVVICVEYNSSLGPDPITVPYDPSFDRHDKHRSGWYHGASLSALAKLASEYGYGLAAISEAGGNAFFTRSGALDPQKAWKPNRLRQQFSRTTQAKQWETIRHLPFVTV
ncbi:hypothetical protein [Bradyrhizobium liaoningense]|uniref:hypothetical protein n=1 Tax=Bradyrhizobium liaoningense TaxID=43992 RepID=UPI0004ADACFF|nr:hypothetical protein [Bradyrhizobium liaoningense]